MDGIKDSNDLRPRTHESTCTQSLPDGQNDVSLERVISISEMQPLARIPAAGFALLKPPSIPIPTVYIVNYISFNTPYQVPNARDTRYARGRGFER